MRPLHVAGAFALKHFDKQFDASTSTLAAFMLEHLRGRGVKRKRSVA
jgi:hypothetical protein